ncbi:hypothetical protein LCGC14_2906970 [marine sediment metagenome]|uniref:tRNA 2-selenouridine synthase AAA domain-containing protein n=1 Tax=marine sediment metagenome TaxID=412755 RepID=A0A0F8YEJ1_9ZZZZ
MKTAQGLTVLLVYLASAASGLGAEPAATVLVEAESSRVGSCTVPPSLWAAMRAARRIEVTAPTQARIGYLLRAYEDITADKDRLDAILAGLVRLQGHDRVETWRGYARDGALRPLAHDLITLHYDPRYAKQRGRDEDAEAGLGQVAATTLDQGDLERLADRIAGMMRSA